MIPFNKAPYTGKEIEYIKEVIESGRICGDGKYTGLCSQALEQLLDVKKVLLTTSCSHALEMSAILCGIKPGDEVIMPSFTFVSTANAFLRLGAKIVFTDIRPDTLNIDEQLIEQAITPRTKVIVPVHYAGVGCEMDKINEIAEAYGIKVVEDAAQAVNAYYKGQALGTLGTYGCYSFHETKNFSMGEGGAICIKTEEAINRAEIIREKGTNRSQFFRGQIDKYTWVDCGSSYLPSDINAAYLYPQLQEIDSIQEKRMAIWSYYHELLEELEMQGYIRRPSIPAYCQHNAHIYHIRVKSLKERTALLNYLKTEDIMATFHYVPLHSSVAGKKWGVFVGEDRYTTQESERLVRLPLYYQMSKLEVEQVVSCIEDFFNKESKYIR